MLNIITFEMRLIVKTKLNLKELLVVILTGNNIYLGINKAILYVSIIDLFIKYQYVNAYFIYSCQFLFLYK